MKPHLFLFALMVASVCGCAAPRGSDSPSDKSGKQPAGAVLLTSPEGRRFVGAQLKNFQVGADGVIGGPDEG